LVLSGYSRLAIDCNRPLESPASIPARSEGCPRPGQPDAGSRSTGLCESTACSAPTIGPSASSTDSRHGMTYQGMQRRA
jgi:N-formylglutamate amidohydrolase